MPECTSCLSHVTEDYVRVRMPQGATNVHGCPDCNRNPVNGEIGGAHGDNDGIEGAHGHEQTPGHRQEVGTQ
jgi:hypothetical protein